MPGRCSLSATPSTFQNAVAAGDALGEQRLDRLEADRRLLHAVAGRRPRPRTTERSTASSDGSPVTPGALALEVLGRADARLGEHGRQRRLDERHHADQVAALLAREPEVVDVEDRHVGARRPAAASARRSRRPACGSSAGRPRRCRSRASDRDVDAGVDRVGREVEQQRGRLVRAVLLAGPAAAGAARAARGGGATSAPLQRTMGRDAPPGHLLAQPDALAVADVPVLLQVLRVRDAQAAPARAGGGRAHPRRRRAPQRQGAAGPHRRGARPPPGRRRQARASSGTPTSPPTSSGSASGRSSAGCCRTRTSACSRREDLARLREVTASQGLMLESVNPDLVAHQGSPTKHPELRLDCIRAAGELKIPFTSGILVGIGETEEERVAALEALAGFEHGHSRRSSSRTSSRTRATTGRSRPRSPRRRRRSTGAPASAHGPQLDLPEVGDAGRASTT